MPDLSDLAARMRHAVESQLTAAEARAKLFEELAEFARAAEVLDVDAKAGGPLSIGFRGATLTLAPSKSDDRIDVRYSGAGAEEAIVRDDSGWKWTGSSRALVPHGLQGLLQNALPLPSLEPPAPVRAPAATPAPSTARAESVDTVVPDAPSARSNVTWVIADRMRVDILAYNGRNCAGVQQVVRIFPGKRRKGDLDGATLQSLFIAGPVGTRVTLCSSDDEEHWQDHPWRCIRLVRGKTFTARNGKPAVRVPDLDLLHNHSARYAPKDEGQSYRHVPTMDDGDDDWTFGRVGTTPLKRHVKMVRIDKE